MKYTHDYATRMPTRETITKPWNNFHGITSMEYGLIFHVTRLGNNFRGICIGYYMLLSVIRI